MMVRRTLLMASLEITTAGRRFMISVQCPSRARCQSAARVTGLGCGQGLAPAHSCESPGGGALHDRGRGERRYRAHQLLARPTIAAVVTEGDMDEVAIIENVQRENLRPMELAESLGRLMETHGYTQEYAAKVIGKARNAVTELLSLLKLPEDIKAQCRTSDIASKSFLVELARMDADAMWPAWDALKAKGESWTSTLRRKGLNELHQITPRDNGIHLIQKFVLAGALGFDGEFRSVEALLL